MVHFGFYVPEKNLSEVKRAVFTAGAGQLGLYDQCCFETFGVGQFRPLAGSQPHLGQENLMEKVKEVKVEMIVKDEHLIDVIHALKESHPYEEPAYFALKMLEV
jgi:hypothetical protein